MPISQTTVPPYAHYPGDNLQEQVGSFSSANLVSASGDAQSVYTGTTGQVAEVRIGTAGSPDTGLNPGVKSVRTLNVTRASVTGDGAEQMAAATGISVGTASNQVQTVGLFGGGTNVGTSNGGSGGVDAVGVYGVGRITGSGIGTGIGAFFAGRRDTTTGKANAMELSAQNFTASVGVVNATGFSDTTGLWIEANGNNDSAVGIGLGNPFGFQYDTGIFFNAQVNNAKTGPVKTASIRDDGTAATSLLINGTHATAAIAIAASSGKVIIGGVAQAVAGALLEVLGSNAAIDPLVVIGSIANTQMYTLRIRNASGQSIYGISGGAGNGQTGTATGDAFIGATSVGKFLHLGGTTSTIKIGQDNTLGFFNGATAAKQTVTGAKGSNAALASLIAALVAHNLITDTTSA